MGEGVGVVGAAGAARSDGRKRARRLAAGAVVGVAIASVPALALAPAALAVTPVTCANVQEKVTAATAGEVLQLPAGVCEVNLKIKNAAAFTLEGASGGGGTTLKPATGKETEPIVRGEQPASGGLSFTLSNLTVTGLKTPPSSTVGAVTIEDPGEAVTISEDTFVGNVARLGAALNFSILTATASKPTVISNDTFGGELGGEANEAEGGGAVLFQSAAPLELINNSFFGNKATSTFSPGGALAIFGLGTTAPVTLSGNTFVENSSDSSGGAAFVQLTHGRPLTLNDNLFLDNTIKPGPTPSPRTGGGLSLALEANSDSGFTAVQSGNSFIGNAIEATGSEEPAGGAGEWGLGVTVQSTADRFEGNRIAVSDGLPKYAPEGGGVGVLGEAEGGGIPPQPGVFVGVDDLFLENAVAPGGWGGAIYSGFSVPFCSASCPGSSVTLEDSTLIGNVVETGAGSQGGAIWGSPNDHLTVKNSIIFSNSTPQVFGYEGASFAFSDVCNEGGGTPVSGAGLLCSPPHLEEGGQETASSPTLGSGSVALVPEGLPTDLAGRPRLTAPGCGAPAVVDMGAFELPRTPKACSPSPPPGSSSGTGSSSGAGPTGAGTLTSGAPHTTANGVEVTVTCKGSGSQFCEGEGSMTTTEHVRGHQVASLSRKRSGKGPRRRTLTVLVGSEHYKLAAGATLKLVIPLNAKGKALLRRFHRVPVRVLVTEDSAKGAVTVFSARATIKLATAHAKPHKHGH